MSQSTANSRKMQEEKCVYRNDEVTSCRLGQIRMVPFLETWENVIPAISRRSVKKAPASLWWRVLVQTHHCNKTAALPQSQAKVHVLRGALVDCGCRCFDVGEV